jgi:hypothetical protein
VAARHAVANAVVVMKWILQSGVALQVGVLT